MDKLRSAFTAFREDARKVLQGFPPQVRAFLMRALVLFIVWKGLYLFLWQVPRTLDEPLTRAVGRQTVSTLNLFYGAPIFREVLVTDSVVIEGEVIKSKVSAVYAGKYMIVKIFDSCNGLELLVLYIGFILAMPASVKRKLLFGIAGLAVIHVVNILRCVGLAAIIIYWRQYFDFAHHYIFKIVIYSTIFMLWVWFSRSLNITTPRHAAV